MTPTIDPERIRSLLELELERFRAQHKRSLALAQRGVEVMPGAVPSNVCAASPFPIVIERGSGARLRDADGNDYIDYANGFGVSVWGHANPTITAAIEAQAQRGTHYGALTEPAIEWAELACKRWGLDWVRFANSGTEATMDAIRLAMAKTGRPLVAKIEGAYHGSHPVALVSPNLGLDGREGPDSDPLARLWGAGVFEAMLGAVKVLPFNDLDAVERALQSERVACLITEPILFNVGAIFPDDGYLAGLRRICDERGTLLIFDETKTAMTVARGGAEELFGVKPHMKTLGKGIGGGLPCGALGDTDGSCYELIHDHEVPHLGTFAGNPLTAAAGAAAIRLMSADAYELLDHHRIRLFYDLEELIGEFELPAYTTSAGAKGCVVWADPEAGLLRNYRDYRRRFSFQLGYLCWLWMVNRGILLAPGQDEQTTHSIAHGDADADRYVAVMRSFAVALRS